MRKQMNCKKSLIIGIAIALFPTTASAEERGAWVKVDASGNAIGQAIVCTQSVCGDPTSLYNKMTLGTNERYILQAPASADGNVAGVGAGQGAKSVKVDLETKVWTVVNESTYVSPKTQETITTTTTQQFTPSSAPWVTTETPSSAPWVTTETKQATATTQTTVVSTTIQQQEEAILASKKELRKAEKKLKKKGKK